jgi:hypothetical protein
MNAKNARFAITLCALSLSALIFWNGCAATEKKGTEDLPIAEEKPRVNSDEPAKETPQTESAAPSADANPATKYRKGDYIRYQYQGSALAHPVTLDEKILSQEGNKLEIHVRASRADEMREWVQVVTDTPHNQANNIIDGLFEVVNGKRVFLENKDNRDVYRLYEWTFPPPFNPEGKPESVTQSVDLGGEQQEAQCTKMKGKSATNSVVALFCTSSSFLWTNAYAQIADEEDGDVLWEMVVVEAGDGEP